MCSCAACDHGSPPRSRALPAWERFVHDLSDLMVAAGTPADGESGGTDRRRLPTSGMPAFQLTVDANDPQVQAMFWADLLGYELTPRRRASRRGRTSTSPWASRRSPCRPARPLPTGCATPRGGGRPCGARSSRPGRPMTRRSRTGCTSTSGSAARGWTWRRVPGRDHGPGRRAPRPRRDPAAHQRGDRQRGRLLLRGPAGPGGHRVLPQPVRLPSTPCTPASTAP